MRKSSVVLVVMLSLIVVFAGVAMADFTAVRVDQPLALDTAWPVADANAIEFGVNNPAIHAADADEGVKAWLLWDDANLYLQYDVTTKYPMANTYAEHTIWNADSVEFALLRSDQVTKEKFIVGLTDSGIQIVTRQPRTIIQNGDGVEANYVATDFGYRGQIIFAWDQVAVAPFNPADNAEILIHIWVNDSKDGVERTRTFGLPGDIGAVDMHHVVKFAK